MSKKGFTLPELLTILVFMGIISLMIFPNITSMLKKTRDNEYNSFLNDVYLATEVYIQKYNNQFPSLVNEDGQAYVYIEELVYANLLKSTTYDPKNEVILKDELDFTVVVTKGEETYQYELVEEKLEKVNYRTSVPELKEGLVPVIISDDGTVIKADSSNLSFSWYNYSLKKWANAVILEDSSIVYNVGDTIPENNIESYFVWIPRYRYKLWDLGDYDSLTSIDNKKVHTISIIFEDKNTEKSNGTCNGSYEKPTIGCYYTHPAFTFGNTELNGIWVGKYETGYNGATSVSGAQSNTENSSKVIIKPNVYSWRYINVSNAFYTSYNYKRELESHMMKNTEWGAVAYLSHSQYGINNSVRINNNSSYKTGYSAVKEPTCGYTRTNSECNKYGTSEDITLPYNTSTGVLASTTGNITGIYDMSGGSHEYIMGIVSDNLGNPRSGNTQTYNSGFMGNLSNGNVINGRDWPERKYYDLYADTSSYTDYKNRILGDATGEMGPFETAIYGSNTRQISSWYNNEQFFPYSSFPWFIRGGIYYFGTGAGAFSFGIDDGSSLNSTTFRIVLSD